MRSLRTTMALGLALLCLAPAARAAEPDKLLPADAELVAMINFKQIIDSPLVKKHALDKIKEALSQPDIKKAVEATGLDPLKDITSIWMAAKTDVAATKKLVVAVRGNFDAAKIEAAAKASAKERGATFESSKEGTLTVYKTSEPGQDAMFSTFADKAFVASPVKDYLLSTVKGGKLNTAMASALGKCSGKESLFVAGVITKELKDALAMQKGFENIAPKLEYATITTTVTDGVDLAVTVMTSDTKTADALKLIAALALPGLKKEVEKNAAVPAEVKELLRRSRSAAIRPPSA